MNETKPTAMIELATGERLYYGKRTQTDTPETAAKIQAGFTSEELMGFHVPAAFAEKLERERDEARREIEAMMADCK